MRDRIEDSFESWGYFIIRFRWPALALSLLLSGFLGSFLSQLVVDNSTESFLRPDDPAVVRYNAFRDQYARDDRVLVALTPPAVFSLPFLEKLRSFHRELEAEVPHVDEVLSLLNARDTRGEEDSLIVGELMEEFPADAAQVDDLRERVRANALYQKVLISPDERLTVVSIKPATYTSLGSEDELAAFDDVAEEGSDAGAEYITGPENREFLAALHRVVERHESPDFPVFVAGALPMTENINEHMARDVGLYMGLGFLAIFGLLLVLFRRLTGVIAPLLVVGLSLTSALGVMILLGIPGSAAVQMLPMLLLSVGICDSVHILTIVYQQLHSGSSKEDAIAFALGHSGLAVLMTSVTTAAGMASFVSADLAPVAHLGIVAPIGVMLALLYTVVLLPALLAIAPLQRTRQTTGRATGRALDRVLARVGGVATRHPWRVLGVSGALILLAVAGLPSLRFEHNALEWFPEGDPVRRSFEVVDAALDGTITLELLVDSGRENGLHDPDTLARIESAMRRAEKAVRHGVRVGKVSSIVDVVKETHQALNENRPEFHRLPENRELIAQELLLFENSGSDDLIEIVDSQFRQARVTLRVPWVDAMRYPPFIRALDSEFKEVLGEGLTYTTTGLMPLMAEIFAGLMTSMARSYTIALLVIVPIMILLLGSLRMGLLAMIPNLTPVVTTLGLMGWLDLPLDASTIMIGAIIIGLAVDDTIHFMHKFQRYFEETGDAALAVQRTLSTTGAALLFTTLVLTAGFGIISLSYLQNFLAFGLLCASATVVAFLADVVLAPALMVLAARWKSSSPARLAQA